MEMALLSEPADLKVEDTNTNEYVNYTAACLVAWTRLIQLDSVLTYRTDSEREMTPMRQAQTYNITVFTCEPHTTL